MDQVLVRRVKLLWAVAGLCLTGLACVGWGVPAAAAAGLAFVGASVLAVVAFVLNRLLGDAPVPLRALLIALFLVGLVVEVCGIASLFG